VCFCLVLGSVSWTRICIWANGLFSTNLGN
jgi:hypothetical protein